MPDIAIPPETMKRILEEHHTYILVRVLKKHLAYYKCVQEAGGDWEDPDCLKILYGGIELPPPGEERPWLEELLAQMPEDEQLQVATSILEAQVRLRDQYIPEIEELIGML
jgi:hypothetical protein